MPSVCLYFKVHHPFQLKQYRAHDVGACHCYEDAAADEAAINKLADACYLPANNILLSVIEKCKGAFKVNFSISGVVLDLLSKYRPDVITSFQALADTGCIEILAETYYHSLSFLHSKKEFEKQVLQHAELVQDLFDLKTKVFRNTELIYNNKLAAQIAALGFQGILCEGIERILQGRTANKVYASPGINEFGLLLRNAVLSDDISFRFDDAAWDKHPLTADRFAEWIHTHPAESEVINLFMDYETFGIHKREESGIFSFLEALPSEVLAYSNCSFNTASEALDAYKPLDVYDVPSTISWEDKTWESCVWCDNTMQNNTLKKIYSLEKMVMHANDDHLTEVWRRLQSADYFYYMANKNCHTNNHHYACPFETPDKVFGYYTNIVTDFEIALIRKALEGKELAGYSTSGTLYQL